ncbi:MAG: sterol desaturase family protein [Acidimicrobiia bacterium]|nr:sterol desaturase family protein [Acidimicrobiia bacterium]
MGAEYAYLKRRAARHGPARTDYEPRDTVTSLAMGVGNLLAPIVMGKLLAPITPTVGRYGKVLVGAAAASVAVTTAADLVARASAPSVADPEPSVGRRRRRLRDKLRNRPRLRRAAERTAAVGGVASVATAGVAVTSLWAHLTAPQRLWERRVLPDLGTGPAAFAAAMVGWDFIYYWNHRFMHECRALWAIHVVHHSSERYNLSTALRQPVADAFGVFVPSGLLCLLGIRPSLVVQARGWNLIYQYWIHTDAIRRLGPAEEVLNTPSLHRVHHGSNPQYLDRNHGGILIVWDRLFGTHEPEDEPVVYGLTKNIDTFNPVRVATHEHRAMIADVAGAQTWGDRVSYVLRGPGWAPDTAGARPVSQVA